MRVGRGGITLVGLFFMVGVAFLSLGPKMPSDPKSPCIVGGRLSHPFRRALLALVILAISRDLIFGLLLDNESSSALLKFSDSFLGTIFTVGQAFLCVSSAYLVSVFSCLSWPRLRSSAGRSLSPRDAPPKGVGATPAREALAMRGKNWETREAIADPS